MIVRIFACGLALVWPFLSVDMLVHMSTAYPHFFACFAVHFMFFYVLRNASLLRFSEFGLLVYACIVTTIYFFMLSSTDYELPIQLILASPLIGFVLVYILSVSNTVFYCVALAIITLPLMQSLPKESPDKVCFGVNTHSSVFSDLMPPSYEMSQDVVSYLEQDRCVYFKPSKPENALRGAVNPISANEIP